MGEAAEGEEEKEGEEGGEEDVEGETTERVETEDALVGRSFEIKGGVAGFDLILFGNNGVSPVLLIKLNVLDIFTIYC